MGMRCYVGAHRWRAVENDKGEHCLYCPHCGAERHDTAHGARVSRPPGPGWTARRLAVTAGRQLARPSAFHLQQLLSHVELGRWLRARGLSAGVGLGGREAVHDVGIELVAGARLVYLEFGVYQGRSLRYWCERVPDPRARFIGFDSFRGLPEDWRPDVTRGRFDTAGVIPRFDDPRVQLVPGWFDETVPGLALPEHDVLVINVDADLYSSALTVLQGVEPHVRVGTLIYFDEFNDAAHELRAFGEFLTRTGVEVQVVARSRSWSHWLFRVSRAPGQPQQAAAAQALRDGRSAG